jgi:hypothetical protein
MSKKTICPECKWQYPVSYLYPMRTSAGDFGALCGICALEISSKALGVKRPKFTGEMAEHLRQMAIKWREVHPDLAPKETACNSTVDTAGH